MKHFFKLKKYIGIRSFGMLAVCTAIAICSTVVVLADEIAGNSTDTYYIEAEAETTLAAENIVTTAETKVSLNSKINNITNETDAEEDDYTIEITNETEDDSEAEPVYPLGNQIADYAYSFVGWLPYVWGGESLEYGADCCGFTQAVYSDFGIDIPRTVEEQAYIGYSVSLEEALPGDLVIYYGHVAIYAGDGMIIHSPYPGTCVTYEEILDGVRDIRRVV